MARELKITVHPVEIDVTFSFVKAPSRERREDFITSDNAVIVQDVVLHFALALASNQNKNPSEPV